MSGTLRPVILVGPTASGKSGLALAAAQALASEIRIEIISVDSAQVYRGLDIGTAKPSAAERAAVPHHGIDLIDAHESYSAAQFVHDARLAVEQIQRRGAWPWLVGGTMLYVKALREGLDDMPASDPAIRQQLDAIAERDGVPALHARLAAVDPTTAQRLKPTDSQRIQRALEVFMGTGLPLSHFHGQTRAAPLDWPALTLEPVQRSWLHLRIAQRFDAMLAAGLVAEVQHLRSRGDLHPDMPAMRCVGYRQLWQALEAGPLEPGTAAWQAAREQGVAATRQLAKRQITWLRSMSGCERLPADAEDILERLLARARQELLDHG